MLNPCARTFLPRRPEANEPQHTLYLHIHQGHGGIYSLPFKSAHPDGTIQKVSAIGTSGCRTCVAVHFPLGEGKCFAAHSDGHVHSLDGIGEKKNFLADVVSGFTLEWLPSEEQGRQLYNTVESYLESVFPGMRDRGLSDYLKRHAILLCPRLTVKGRLTTGGWICKAFNDFLGLERTGDEIRSGHGFIIDYSKDVPVATILGYEEKAPSEQEWDFMPDEEFHDMFGELTARQVTEKNWQPINRLSWTLMHWNNVWRAGG
ncbi:hypothetical protein HII31_06304 [Pseudocercospora fuligena]|uniref:Uncharacterized protein n=1 Tax=Pseudocercospora fuligena TaxID=685502 RepID=A0A8H6RK00_9PEZI|nr:hypothetical protein HII31_06304 [Pseudocercospora fuligena]